MATDTPTDTPTDPPTDPPSSVARLIASHAAGREEIQQLRRQLAESEDRIPELERENERLLISRANTAAEFLCGLVAIEALCAERATARRDALAEAEDAAHIRRLAEEEAGRARAERELEDALAELARLREIVEPKATVLERQGQVIDFAREIGFKQAGEALWDDYGEWPADSIDTIAENLDYDGVATVNLGVLLGANVYVSTHYDEATDEHNATAHETEADAKEAAAREAGKETP